MPTWSQERPQPPWSKSHTVKLAPPDVYDSASKADKGINTVSGHTPNRLVESNGEVGRRAGMYGMHVQDDDGIGEPAGDIVHDWEKVLYDDKKVVSVRDVKKASKDFKIIHPRAHAFARYVLPVSEADIKEQDWPGKKKGLGEQQKEGGEDKQNSKESKCEQTETKDGDGEKKQTGDQRTEKKGKEEDEQGDEAQSRNEGGKDDKNDSKLTDEQEEFFQRLIEEMRTVESFKNNPGEPDGELKLLDDDALLQLESRLSVDDQMTPDSWIPRSTELIRLTGKHPLNAEVHPLRLFEAGMITPTKLHYVRSHGAVPQLNWETHKLEVFAEPANLLARPREWSMDELADGEFKIIELPVTFGCDGNRRKEMNMMKKTTGFNFTTAGVSTCLWRGVLVRDVLLTCGLQDQPDDERWYLNFEGADEPSEGPYATSIPLLHAMNPANDVMLVFGQNGRVLHPDHGYGFVGGRQVKWLKKMWVTKKPNRSHYHIWDNRVVPTFIDSKEHPLATAFFHHEDTGCYEQCLQSAICKPAHSERISLADKNRLEGTYTVEGYAFSSGDRIGRVELSMDGGKTWKYCFRRFVKEPLRHGEKYWAWIFWSCELKVQDMTNAREIICRAQDSRKNYQPAEISWNLMGMMNNAWYRIRPQIEQDPESGLPSVKFLHPVAPGNDEGGWMKQADDTKSDDKDKPDKVFSLEEIAKHNNKDDAWIILDNKVYDVTSVLSWHPGGAQAILAYAGKATVDVTNEYKGIHDNYANSKKDECLIGALSDEGIKAMREDAERAAQELTKVKEKRKGLALQPDVYTHVKLIKRMEISPDTRLYTFELPKRDDGSHGVLGLPVGQHVQIAVHFKDQAVMRSYTPVRPVLPHEEDGTMDLLVKTYMPSNGGPFPPGGTVSNYLDCMEEGEEIDIRGPNGGIKYMGHGRFEIEDREYHFNKINLVAGGSGLTPHWQLIHAVLSDDSDKTLVSLIDSNKTYDDILMREELQKYADEKGDKFKLWHVLSGPPEDVEWKYSEGRLDQKMMEEHFYPAEDGVGTFLCGPPPMIEKAALPGLKKMGFEDGKTVFGY